MELEVGMYTYSKQSRDYGIGKIVKIHTNGFTHSEVEIQYKDVKISTRYDYVVGSHNIIDLIEGGDYVNGYRVYNKGIDELGYTYLSLDMNEDIHWLESEIENEEQIKSIVTKEQFESMSYKVGE